MARAAKSRTNRRYSTIPESIIQRACTTPNLQVVAGEEGILGWIRANWKAPDNSLPNLWENNKFALADFKHLATYLSRSSASEPEREVVLRELLTQALAQGAAAKARAGNA